MTSAILLPTGTSPAPRGVVLPDPTGVASYYEFGTSTWETSRRNLYDPAAPAATVVGSPPLAGGFATFPGMTDYLDTTLTETPAMGVLALVRIPGGLVDKRHRIIGNYNTTGFALFITTNGLELFVTREGNTAAFQGGKLSPPPDMYAGWCVLSCAFGGTSLRVRNLSVGTSVEQTLTTPRAVVVSETLRIGTNASPAPSLPGPTDIRAMIVWRNHMPTLAEENANAAGLVQRAAAAGITVPLAAP